ncbi:MAG: DUF134 domain-containing protein, partial [Nanobdellota archaeon]
MPRPRRCRRISSNPCFYFFKPAGVGLKSISEKILTIDEYEALRLKDYNGLGQNECSQKMEISQPTFHRLLLQARQKVADCLVNGKAIKIEKSQSEDFHTCTECSRQIYKSKSRKYPIKKCPECG